MFYTTEALKQVTFSPQRSINGEVDGDKAAALAHIDAVERLFAKRAL